MAFHRVSQVAEASGGLRVEGSGRMDFYLCIRCVPSWFFGERGQVEMGYTE